MRRRILQAVCFGVLLPSAVLFGRPQETPFRVHDVAGNVRYIEGAGGNIGVLLGEGGLLLVDDQLASAREGVVSAVEGIADVPVEFLLNTHWHGDHTGNNEVFGAGTIVAHRNVRRRLAGDETIEGRRNEGTPAVALPDVTFESSVSLHYAGEEVEVVHYGPGHTDGDGVVFFYGSRVVHMGDLFFAGRFPYIDLGSGGSAEGYHAAVGAVLERLRALEDADTLRIVPGHGPLSGVADLAAFHGMLGEAITRVREALAEGWTLDEMQSRGLLEDFAPTWGTGFIDADRFVEILARSLAD